MNASTRTVGRYAPSPTGDMHLGNLRTALLAWLHSRLQGGTILLRMDDLDQLRVVEGSGDQILRDLEWLGLEWDGEIVYQSERTELYQNAMQQLVDQDLVYECFCSRKDIREASSAPHGQELRYPGTCVNLDSNTANSKRQEKPPAIRVRVGDGEVVFVDNCVGECRDDLSKGCGDFVIKRADGLFAYQLATAVDDMQQGITDVVRGADLVDSTSRQIYLMQKLNPDFALPQYWHVPLMLDDKGERMAKRYGSMSAEQWRAQGSTAEELIGYLAASVKLIDQVKPLSATDLLAQISLQDW